MGWGLLPIRKGMRDQTHSLRVDGWALGSAAPAPVVQARRVCVWGGGCSASPALVGGAHIPNRAPGAQLPLPMLRAVHSKDHATFPGHTSSSSRDQAQHRASGASSDTLAFFAGFAHR